MIRRPLGRLSGLLLGALLAATPAAHGAPPPPVPAALPPHLSSSVLPTDRLFVEAYRKARVQRNLGWAFEAAGTVGLVAGAACVIFAFTDDRESYQGHLFAATTGLITAVVGALLLIPGVVLAIRGQEHMAAARFRLTPLLGPSPTGGSVGLHLRF